MASLKEVKNRINSVTSTRKITSAMKLVASSKLHKAQGIIENMLPYEHRLNGIMSSFIGQLQGEVTSPYIQVRPVNKAVIVVFSSNTSLCGAFNSNVIKELQRTIQQFKDQGVKEVEVLPIGNKVAEKVGKLGFDVASSHANLLDKPNYRGAADIAMALMQRYIDKEIDKVVIIYNHFKNTATQILRNEEFMPVNLNALASYAPEAKDSKLQLDYIIEPSVESIIEELIPNALHLKMYTSLLDSLASEHAARVMAMQVATDNADELLSELTLMYNKTRQAAITSELLDIVGVSFQ